MVDRKEKSVTFRSPVRNGLGDLKAGIDKEINDTTNVFQDLGDNLYLLALETKADAELLVSNGFEVDEFHIDCFPPHGKFLNVNILGLRSYVQDDEVKMAFMEYGVLKSDVIRLETMYTCWSLKRKLTQSFLLATVLTSTSLTLIALLLMGSF